MPTLSPPIAEIRRAVRAPLSAFSEGSAVLIALSGGQDSLALAAATAFEARSRGIRVCSLTVDHGLQQESAAVAERAVAAARSLGIDATSVRVEVEGDGGPEAAARAARYAALLRHAEQERVAAVFLGHTLDDQAETVLLGLARGSGASSLQGMSPDRTDDEGVRWVRPLLGVRRATTGDFCTASALAPWNDPQNEETRFTRVRVRSTVLPVLEEELGPGIAEALARTAEQLREDAEAFEEMIHETIEDIVEPAEAGISISVPALAANPAAIRNRIIRLVVASEFGASLTRLQTVEVARLVTDWSGQGPIDLPNCSAQRSGGRIIFSARH